MNQESGGTHDSDLELLSEVDALSEEIKILALNLALYLAKAKSGKHSAELTRLEPEFIRLINNTVKIVRELSLVVEAAKNREIMVYQVPSGQLSKDRVEVRLHAILEQCTRILNSIRQVKDIVA